MDYVFSMLAVVAAAMVCLMAHVMTDKWPWQSAKATFFDSLAWGLGGFVSFAVEILAIWKWAW